MDTPSDVQDMSISLYGERLHQPEGKGMTPYYGKYEGSNEKSRREFLLHTYELIDQYQPELIWFDWTVGKYPFSLLSINSWPIITIMRLTGVRKLL